MMKKSLNSLLFYTIALLGTIILLHSCKKEDDPSDDDPPYVGPVVPTASTIAASWVKDTTATLNGMVKAGNDTAAVVFEFGLTSDYGNIINAVPDTVTGTDSTDVSVELTGLTPGTRYYFRVRAINSLDTTFGAASSFTTFNPVVFNSGLAYGSVTDIEGNSYNTIVIGTQTWMAENLRTSTFNDGTAISLVTENADWEDLTGQAFCWYNNNSDVYGALYNWHAVNSGTLCPAGWHVPTDEEWDLLTGFLGGNANAGNKLKEEGTFHWLDPNAGAINESGFTALPGGYRNAGGKFGGSGRYGYWWTATELSAEDAYFRDLSYSYSNVDRSSSNKKSALSVRCVMD